MPFPLLYEAFYQSGRALGVRGYQISGDQGDFFAPLFDQTIAKTYLRTKSWSPDLVEVLRQSLAGGGVFLDVGANIGLVTVPLAQNAAIRCIALEPDPQNYRLLQANVLTNCPHKNVEVFNAAAYREETELAFQRSEYNSGDHRVSKTGTVRVRGMRLDDIPRPPGYLAIKIDTQGAEPAVFEGARESIASADVLICEYWPWAMRRMGLSPGPVLDGLAKFRKARIYHNGRPTAWMPIGDAITQLDRVTSAGGEHDQVDILAAKEV
ncbi:MAG: FkbM family methyltransferase [Bryobacteraceae bacterium]